MKAILEFDMPENCALCELKCFNEVGFYCAYTGNSVDRYVTGKFNHERPKTCPLMETERGINDTMIHNLKTWPEYYEAIEMGAKTFEIRKNDREFKVGDILSLEEYNPNERAYTGRVMRVIISYILAAQPFVPEGYVCMAIHKL